MHVIKRNLVKNKVMKFLSKYYETKHKGERITLLNIENYFSTCC